MKENLVPLVSGIICLAIGIVCLFWPKKIQQFSLELYARHEWAARLNPFLDWMKTSSYVWTLRTMGVIGIGMFVLSIYVIFRSYHK